MKKLLIWIILLLSIVSNTSYAQKKAIKPLREGAHNLTLQWIGWDHPGKAQIKKKSDGTYSIKGEQRGENGDFLSIDGALTVVSATELTFTGTIKRKCSYIYNGDVCDKTGTYHFLAKGASQYWRLQEMDNCAGENQVIDHVDIFL